MSYYRILYGKESRRSRSHATFAFRNGTQLELAQTGYVYGKREAAHRPFRNPRAAFRSRGSGQRASLHWVGVVLADDGRVLRLKDADGIELELVTG